MPEFFNAPSAASSGQDTPAQKPDTAPGTAESTILQNHYVLIGPLGQGGMGTVFMAQDTSLFNRLCVVKKLRLDGFNERDKHKATEFFQREARVLSSLQHPNVVHIQAYFQERGNYYLVMEYVEGNNLLQLLKKRGAPFCEKEVISWTATILNVLHYLHNYDPPVIYRDIKPSNIMVDTVNSIKLVDFGIARPYSENSENTHVVSGGYSPPEQYWGAADPRSDIYALGATMHYLLAGHEPIALQSCSPKQHNSKVSDFLDKIVQRATAQDVWVRYQSAAEMLGALEAAPKRQPVAVPYAYVIMTCLATLTTVLLAFAAIDCFHKQPAGQNLLTAKTPKQARANNVSHLPLEFARSADSEEFITDPDGLKSTEPVANEQASKAANFSRWH